MAGKKIRTESCMKIGKKAKTHKFAQTVSECRVDMQKVSKERLSN